MAGVSWIRGQKLWLFLRNLVMRVGTTGLSVIVDDVDMAPPQ